MREVSLATVDQCLLQSDFVFVPHNSNAMEYPTVENANMCNEREEAPYCVACDTNL